MPRSAPAARSPALSSQTRQRLLGAGGEVFSRQGFRRATVREICKRAGANVAAVNYYFGDKQRLYAAVLQHWVGLAVQKYPPDMGVLPGASPRQRLHAFVRSFLFRILDEGASAWHGRLMVREMAEPTDALDGVLQQTIRPLARQLEAIVRELLGTGAPDALVQRCALSVIGQCCLYRHAEPVISRLRGRAGYEQREIEALAKHITRYSLAGIRACGKSGAKREAHA